MYDIKSSLLEITLAALDTHNPFGLGYFAGENPMGSVELSVIKSLWFLEFSVRSRNFPWVFPLLFHTLY